MDHAYNHAHYWQNLDDVITIASASWGHVIAAVAVEKQVEGSGGASRRPRAAEAAKFCESKRLESRRRQETERQKDKYRANTINSGHQPGSQKFGTLAGQQPKNRDSPARFGTVGNYGCSTTSLAISHCVACYLTVTINAANTTPLDSDAAGGD